MIQTSNARDVYHTFGYKSAPMLPCLGPHHKVRLYSTKKFSPHSFYVRTTCASSVFVSGTCINSVTHILSGNMLHFFHGEKYGGWMKSIDL